MTEELNKKLKDFLDKELDECFAYECMNSRNRPVNPGFLLEEFNSDGDYLIRPKYMNCSVTADPDGPLVKVDYESQERDQDTLENALSYFFDAHLPDEIDEFFEEEEKQQFLGLRVVVNYGDRDGKVKNFFETVLY